MSLLNKNIHEIIWQDVEDFCGDRIPEGPVLDYKEDFPNNLEKTLAAMSNTLGGIILIGVKEDAENRPSLPVNGIEFKKGLSERVYNIILDNITPPFLPDVHVVLNKTQDRSIVVIRIPQSHQTPHTINGNTQVYLRTGNRNKSEDLASLDQIQWLLSGRRKSEEFRQQLYRQAETRLKYLFAENIKNQKTTSDTPLSLPTTWLLLTMCPLFPKERFIDPPNMYEVYRASEVDVYKGMPIFPPQANRYRIVQDGFVRQGDDGGLFHYEFNSFGLYFYKEEIAHFYPDQPAKIIYASEMFLRLDEFLESSILFYKQLGYWGSLEFRASLEGIRGCILRKIDRNSHSTVLNSPDDEVRVSAVVNAGVLKEQKRELILRAAQPMSWAFDWGLVPEVLDSYYEKARR